MHATLLYYTIRFSVYHGYDNTLLFDHGLQYGIIGFVLPFDIFCSFISSTNDVITIAIVVNGIQLRIKCFLLYYVKLIRKEIGRMNSSKILKEVGKLTKIGRGGWGGIA